MGGSAALAIIAAYALLVPRPADGDMLGVAGYTAGIAVAMLVGLACLVRLTFAVRHPEMPRLGALPPRRADEASEFYAVVHDVLDETPETLRVPIDDGRVTVRISSDAAGPRATVVRSRRAVQLVISRAAVRRDLDEAPDAAYERLAAAVREALAHGLSLDELGVRELDALSER
jgi:hypothetical protein